MTLISAALLAPFPFGPQQQGALVTIDPPGSIDTPAFGISLTGEIVGLFITSDLRTYGILLRRVHDDRCSQRHSHHRARHQRPG